VTNLHLGFHFNARNATTDQIQGFCMELMEKMLETQAPQLCDLIGSLLTSDVDLESRRLDVPDVEDEPAPEDLGELSADDNAPVSARPCVQIGHAALTLFASRLGAL
jgi:hypothetical protein